MCFQKREPFKKRWFSLCLMNRKLLYFKSPLVMKGGTKHLKKKSGGISQKSCAIGLELKATLLLFWPVLVRTPLSGAPYSLAQRATDTLCRRAADSAREEGGGAAGSPWRLRKGSLSSCVNRNQSRGSGRTL